ncbi:MAG: hypothetical protein VB104_13205 [Candidatus Limiplasma sp.]|nr:hypothetical protein [Candidatus Limiplasma sp.]
MKIDLTCPVELWQYTTPAESNPVCTFMLNNLSDKVVTSVQTTLVCYGAGEQLLFRQVERVQGLSAGAGERFSLTIAPSQWEAVTTVDLVIEKVWFDDATIWRRGSAALTEYESNALPAGRRLDQLRFVAGPDAVGYPEWQRRVWVCVCGRANDLHNDRCCRCERRRDTVFATCSRENVEQLIAVHEQKLHDAARAAREDASRLTEERERERLAQDKHRRTLRRLAIAAACLVVLLATGLLWGLPALRYAQASSLLGSGQYEQARTALKALQGYGNTATLLQECDYRQATDLAASAADADLARAVTLFEGLGDYQDSAAQAQAARYRAGTLALDAGRYDAAAADFQSLGDYSDSRDQFREAQYRQADSMAQNESYVAARILFADLGDYRDAAARKAECSYALGAAALASGDYETAVQQLSDAGQAQDAPELYKQASYLLAEQCRLNGDFERAGKLYQQAGDYSDAKIRANGSLYELARERMQAGDYAKATELFQSVVPYLDSETQGWECVYQQALAAVNTGDDDTAVMLLASIPKHEKGAALLQECRYRLAAKMVATGDRKTAISLYSQLGDYQDASTKLSELRYQAAEEALAAGRYQDAAALYESLGKYQDSADKWNQCRYALAAAALEQKNYRDAIEGFAALGTYQDSAKQADAATFALALQLKTSGNTDAAVELLKSLDDSTEAKQQLREITLSEADRAQAAGDLARASELYLALGDYGDAPEKYNACQYALAMQKKDAGDMRAAMTLFAALGDYQDAAAQAAACEQEAYGRYAAPARKAYAAADWPTVITTLETFDDSNLPAAYRDLAGMYAEACYQYAEALFAAGKPYEALPYYQRIPEYKDVATKKLTRRAYLILGVWENADGTLRATFRDDGTCTLFDGQTMYFSVDGYALNTGATPETLALTHKLTTLTEDSLSLRVLADSRVTQLHRIADAQALATATATPATATATPATVTVAPATATPAPKATVQPTVKPTAAPTPTTQQTAGPAAGNV